MKTELRSITTTMRAYERVINFYNRKYNYEMEQAKPKEIKQYEASIRIWDFLKAKRDQIKAAI